MIYTIEELRNKIFGKVFEVYDIFKDFFGEEHVDLQGLETTGDIKVCLSRFLQTSVNTETIDISDETYQAIHDLFSINNYYIYVWWPDVRVTNEYDKYVDIKDLYAKVTINIYGCIPYESHGFLLDKATYTVEQFNSGYVHSHVMSFTGHPRGFQQPCLGRGPINGTITELKNTFNEVTWMLFCQELSLYVTVESIQGVPYIRMERIGNTSKQYYGVFEHGQNNIYQTPLYKRLLKEEGDCLIRRFITYYLKHGHLKLDFDGNRFRLGLTYFDYVFDISNTFIEWFNTENKNPRILNALYESKSLIKVTFSNNKFYISDTLTPSTIRLNENRKVLTFKGRDIYIKISGNAEHTEEITILNADIMSAILYKILLILNFHYGHDDNTSSQTTRVSSSVCYI